MKAVLSLWLILMMSAANGQMASFSSIDRDVENIDAGSPDSLAYLLTSPYRTDTEKVRAIYSWIAQHISYNTFVIGSFRRSAGAYVVPEDDTTTIWKEADEMTAIRVLKRRTAVCDGYAKLFKTLCDYAGICSEVISGYARGYIERNNSFRTNHNWNAVMIDGTWQLVDVTWGSGYVNFANQFVQRTNDAYFLTPPDEFVKDHFPEDLSWTLLQQLPMPAEFKKTPYRFKNFLKYSISDVTPVRGLIEAMAGDTIQIELSVANARGDRQIASDPFFDSSWIRQAGNAVFLKPTDSLKGKYLYRYVADATATGWINIMYNNDIIMRYCVRTKKDVSMRNPDTY